MAINWNDLPNIVLAVGAIGTTAFSVVDAFKFMGGGPSNLGFDKLKTVYMQMGGALQAALGDDWLQILKGYWLNGTDKDRQIAVVMSALRLGLNKDTCAQVAKNAGLDETALGDVVKLLDDGTLATSSPDGGMPADAQQNALNMLGRLDAYYRTRLDAAYDRADQVYRNGSRCIAGVVAVILSVIGGFTVDPAGNPVIYVLIGLAAVPLAPVAKDLASALKAAADNMKTIVGKA